MPREYRYLLLDVFTETALAGNQLAVFLDAEGLSDAEMQALARETNLSETTFCFPGESQAALEHGVRVRIFTTDEEFPFAGHPTLGTAAALRWTLPELRDAAEVRLRLNVGLVPVRYPAADVGDGTRSREAEELRGTAPVQEVTGLPFGQPVYGEMEQPRPVFGQQHDRAAVAVALGLPLEALDPDLPAETVSTGIPFVVVPLVSREALRALSVPLQASAAYLDKSDAKFPYVIAPGANEAEWHARMPFNGGEDPATGSAAGCAASYLVRHRPSLSGKGLTVYQGAEIKRPSTLHCRAVLSNGEQNAAFGLETGQIGAADGYVRVGGSTVLVAEGRFFLF